ncbi:MAG TPA: peptidylprolyl isomerase [Xanthobacteraceae bacterium]|jgi:peptidyl-prolyl cis-trans isomerase SurA|nr:peptidylprolyl isomerase [Xanthobacteraceae bacterium]
MNMQSRTRIISLFAPCPALRTIGRLAFAGALALWASALAPLPAAAQQVAVIVNGDPITTYDIEQRGRFMQLVSHKAAPRQQVIDDLINEKLKIQVGKRYKLEVTDHEVDTAYGEMAKRMRLTPQQLTQALAHGGVDSSTLKARIRADIVWGQIVRGKFQSAFQINEKDVLQVIESKKDDKDKGGKDKDLIGHEYTLRPILFILPRGAPESAVESRRREAEALRSRFQNCESGIPFARALRDVAVREPVVRNSADLAPALRDILEKTEVGKATAPEVTPDGVQIFALCSKRETKADSPEEREVRDKMFAERFQEKSKRYLQELRKSAMIEVK